MAAHPHDVAVLLALAAPSPPPTYAALGQAVGISPSQAHASVRRLRSARLLDASGLAVDRAATTEFIIHSVPKVFPAAQIPDPLFPRLPGAIDQDAWLSRVVGLVDQLRAHAASEETTREIRAALAPNQGRPVVDLRRPSALARVFDPRRLDDSIDKRLNDPRWRSRGHLRGVSHIFARPILCLLHDPLVRWASERGSAGTYRPHASTLLVGHKVGGARDLVYPALVDSLIASRLVDEIGAQVTRPDGRTFLARQRHASLEPQGHYTTGGGTWLQFVDSLAEDKRVGMAFALRTDIREFYPSVDHVLLRQVVAQQTGARPEVIDLMMRFVEAWTPPGLRGRGLPIDDQDVGAVLAHTLLRNVDDLFPDTFDFTYRRFVDDTVVFCESEDQVRAFHEEYRTALRQAGLSLHPTKGEVGPAEKVVEQLRDAKAHQRIANARHDPRQLMTMYSEFQNMEESRSKTARLRHTLRHLGVSACPPTFLDQVLADLTAADRAAATLSFLATQTLDADRVHALTAHVFAHEAERVRVLETLSRAVLSTPEAVLDHARRALHGGEVEQVKAAVLLFRVLGPDDACWEQWRPSNRGLAAATQRALAPACGVEPVDSDHPDSHWSDRLLDGLRLRELPFRDLTKAITWGENQVVPEHLPLLHLAVRSGARDEVQPLLDTLSASPDPALGAHGKGLSRKRAVTSASRMSGSGWRVGFLHLVSPRAAHSPAGELSELSMVPPQHLRRAVQALDAVGLIRNLGRVGRRVVDPLDLWRAFESEWRTGLAVAQEAGRAVPARGTFREWLAGLERPSSWGALLGGQAAAEHRGQPIVSASAVLHVTKWDPTTMRALGVVPSAEGPITIRRRLTTLDHDPQDIDCAHPILVRAELMLDPDPRLDEVKRALSAVIQEGLKP